MTLQEPSVSMRVNAESDWAFSKPIIVLDVLWNLAFVVIAVVLLGLSVKEEPEVPLRLWIIGYGLQCVFHIACVIFQYRRRPSGRSVGFGGNGDSTSVPGSDGGDSVGYGAEQRASDDETRYDLASYFLTYGYVCFNGKCFSFSKMFNWIGFVVLFSDPLYFCSLLGTNDIQLVIFGVLGRVRLYDFVGWERRHVYALCKL